MTSGAWARLVFTTHGKGDEMLEYARVATRPPCQDLARARRFYAGKLGLEPADERPGGLLYRMGTGDFALSQSAGASPGTFTQIGFEVDDIEGNYPSKGSSGERGAWFRDSEGNMLGVGQLVR
jgi:catechol 2,3-dioxygenase-like lactoylglutathione lyase family enzyme